jgi:hypothetical protein
MLEALVVVFDCAFCTQHLLIFTGPMNSNWREASLLNYGDNKQPGRDLHYPRGNQVLRNVFDALHSGQREETPPFFVFTQGPEGRDVIFRGLAVPGAPGVSQRDDLIAIWKTRNTQRFQNYRATFTILDEPKVQRAWIEELHNGNPFSSDAPQSWLQWITGGRYVPLRAPRTVSHRTRLQQIPRQAHSRKIIETITSYFNQHPGGVYAFEHCAAEIARLMDSNIISYDLTRPWRDGGRDAIGSYRIGHKDNAIEVVFALEAKCNDIRNGCGVRQTSRLISRLRYRQFGIFLTTSYVSQQAYQEIVEDEHPVIIVSAADIANILVRAGINSIPAVQQWLERNFPPDIS